MYNRAVSSVLRNTENVWRKRATEESHQWALLGSWNNTIMHCTWESLPFCQNLFHLEDLQQMVWPLALLACLCLLVFKWTCSHNETSCRVSFLLSHFWSLGIHNSESRTCARSSVQDSCYLVLRPRLLRGAGGGRWDKGKKWALGVLFRLKQSWCRANLLWCFAVGDVSKHIPLRQVMRFIVSRFVFPRMRNNLFKKRLPWNSSFESHCWPICYFCLP